MAGVLCRAYEERHSYLILDVNSDRQRRILRRKYSAIVLKENSALQRQMMEIFKRKKAVFITCHGASAKEFQSAPKQIVAERRVLSDNSNITVFSKKQSTECPKVVKPKSTFRVTPGPPGNRKARKSKPIAKPSLCLYGPERLIPFDEPMELDDPALRLRTLLKTVPVGVRDIDTGEGEFYSPCYAQDIIDYLQAVETRWTFPRDYLEDQGEVTSSMRSVLMDWLIQVQCHEHLQEDTLHLAVAMIDRYSYVHVPRVTQVQLLGITCLLISAKFVERFPPEIDTLCHLTADAYNKREVIEMEIDILKRLKFDINIPGPIVFLDRFLKAEKNDSTVVHLCNYILDLSLVSVGSVQFVASMLAASAIYVARRILGAVTRAVWTANLAFYTKYSENDLQPCVRHVDKLLSRVQSVKYKAAFNKYNKPQYGCISYHPQVYKE